VGGEDPIKVRLLFEAKLAVYITERQSPRPSFAPQSLLRSVFDSFPNRHGFGFRLSRLGSSLLMS
jgi:hypothetical protein